VTGSSGHTRVKAKAQGAHAAGEVGSVPLRRALPAGVQVFTCKLNKELESLFIIQIEIYG
jgi:hypothetical protein